MNDKTISILNELNKKFYNETGSLVWNQKPDYFWEGWYQLKKHINTQARLLDEYKILDLGCGNGRFANFIKQEIDTDIVKKTEYLGVDFSINFMNRSEELFDKKFVKHEMRQMDILNGLGELKNSKFDLIVMFGVIHHIPSFEARKFFFSNIKNLLSENGLLVFTTWQYLDTPRLIKRVVNPETPTGKEIYNQLGITKTELEDGDNILDWVKKVFCLRYSHYFSEDEINTFLIKNNLKLINSFVCDGRDSKRNKYFVCKISSISNQVKYSYDDLYPIR